VSNDKYVGRYNELTYKDGNEVVKYDATIYSKDEKPCAVVLSDSENNSGAKFSQLKQETRDEITTATANGIAEIHKEEMIGRDRLYAYSQNADSTYKQQPYELHVTGSIHDQSAEERSMIPYSKDTGTDHNPLDSVHKDRMEYTISELQDRGLSDNNFSSINQSQPSPSNSPTQSR